MKCELRTICDFRKGKIEVSKLNQSTYISTENMVPDKGGVVEASSLPNSLTTQEFQPGDILVSNIRPYFKKIWHAKYSGGCSNDVLVFTAKGGVDPTFLYYLLSDDAFFSFSTATSKGTKMPRGDRKAIMQYAVPQYDFPTQKKIGSILRSLDDKIELNNKINENLEQQAQSIYHEWFETVKTDELPAGCRVVTLGDVAIISKKSFNPLTQPETMLEHYSIPAFDELRFPVFESSKAIKSNKFVIDDCCIMISKLNPTTKRVWRPYCLTETAVCSTEFIVYKAKDSNMTDFLYSAIDSVSFSDFMCSHVTGSTGSRQRTTPSDTLSFEFVLPSKDTLNSFLSLVSPMYAQMRINAIQNDKLKQLRDSLLPKLMSGEIDVEEIAI